jgi:hypothetical protein
VVYDATLKTFLTHAATCLSSSETSPGGGEKRNVLFPGLAFSGMFWRVLHPMEERIIRITIANSGDVKRGTITFVLIIRKIVEQISDFIPFMINFLVI